MSCYSFNIVYRNYVANHYLEDGEHHIAFTVFFIYQPLLVTSSIVLHYNSVIIEWAYTLHVPFRLIDTGYDIYSPLRDYAEELIWEFYARLYQEDEKRFYQVWNEDFPEQSHSRPARLTWRNWLIEETLLHEQNQLYLELTEEELIANNTDLF